VSTAAASVVGAVLGFMASGIIFLAYSVSRTRERVARVEQRLDDLFDRRPRRRRQEEDEEL